MECEIGQSSCNRANAAHDEKSHRAEPPRYHTAESKHPEAVDSEMQPVGMNEAVRQKAPETRAAIIRVGSCHCGCIGAEPGWDEGEIVDDLLIVERPI